MDSFENILNILRGVLAVFLNVVVIGCVAFFLAIALVVRLGKWFIRAISSS